MPTTKLDSALPDLLGLVVNELHYLQKQEDEKSRAFRSVLYQAISMAFAYDSNLVFNWLNRQNLILEILNSWFLFMNEFVEVAELRCVIFGLCGIVSTPEKQLPVLVRQKLPQITNLVSLVTQRAWSRRHQLLSQNKLNLRVDQNPRAEVDSQDENEEEDDPYAFSDSEESAAEELGGQAISAHLYESRTDTVDEIKTVKETLDKIEWDDYQLYLRMMEGITDAEQKKRFKYILREIPELIQDEEKLEKDAKAFEDSQKAAAAQEEAEDQDAEMAPAYQNGRQGGDDEDNDAKDKVRYKFKEYKYTD